MRPTEDSHCPVPSRRQPDGTIGSDDRRDMQSVGHPKRGSCCRSDTLWPGVSLVAVRRPSPGGTNRRHAVVGARAKGQRTADWSASSCATFSTWQSWWCDSEASILSLQTGGGETCEQYHQALSPNSSVGMTPRSRVQLREDTKSSLFVVGGGDGVQ